MYFSCSPATTRFPPYRAVPTSATRLLRFCWHGGLHLSLCTPVHPVLAYTPLCCPDRGRFLVCPFFRLASCRWRGLSTVPESVYVYACFHAHLPNCYPSIARRYASDILCEFFRSWPRFVSNSSSRKSGFDGNQMRILLARVALPLTARPSTHRDASM